MNSGHYKNVKSCVLTAIILFLFTAGCMYFAFLTESYTLALAGLLFPSTLVPVVALLLRSNGWISDKCMILYIIVFELLVWLPYIPFYFLVLSNPIS